MGIQLNQATTGNEVLSDYPAISITSYRSTVGGSAEIISDYAEIAVTGSSSRVDDGDIPDGWFLTDIGDADPAGSASENVGTWNLTGGGPNPAGTDDGGFFAYRVVEQGSATITARIARPVGDQWDQLGLMIRDSLAANAIRITLFLTPGDSGSHLFTRYRTVAGTIDENAGNLNAIFAFDYWLRIIHEPGNTTVYGSSTGVGFTELFSTTDLNITPSDSQIFVGIYASNSATGESFSGTIDNVTITTVPVNQNVLSPQAAISVTPYDAEITPIIGGSGVYFVDGTNGSDANAGTATQPFRTIQKGLDTVVTGQTLYIRAGTYSESPAFINDGPSFQPGQTNRILVDGFPGEEVILTERWIPNGKRGYEIGANLKWVGGDSNDFYLDKTCQGIFGTQSASIGDNWKCKFKTEHTRGYHGISTQSDNASRIEVTDSYTHRHGTIDVFLEGGPNTDDYGDFWDLSDGTQNTNANYVWHYSCFINSGHDNVIMHGADLLAHNNIFVQDWVDEVYQGSPYPTIDGQSQGSRPLSVQGTGPRNFIWNNVLLGGNASRDFPAGQVMKFFTSRSVLHSNYIFSSSGSGIACLQAGGPSVTPSTSHNRIYHNVFAHGRGNVFNGRGWDNGPPLSGSDLYAKGIKIYNNIIYNFSNNPGESREQQWIHANCQQAPYTVDFSTLLEVKGNVFISDTEPTFRFLNYSNGPGEVARSLSYFETNFPSQFSDNTWLTLSQAAQFISDVTYGTGYSVSDILAAAKSDPRSAAATYFAQAVAAWTATGDNFVNAGIDLTTTSAGGAFTSQIPVNDIVPFRGTNNWDTVPRQRITIGRDPVETYEIISVAHNATGANDDVSGTITIAGTTDFSNGDAVNYAHNGSAPNVGPKQ